MMGKASEEVTRALKTIYAPEYVAAGQVYEGLDYDHGSWLHAWWFKPLGEPAVYFGESKGEALETPASIRQLEEGGEEAVQEVT